MRVGVCKFFDEAKGFGFIRDESTGEEFFVHARALQRSGISELAKDARVSFTVETSPKTGKPECQGIALIERAPSYGSAA